MKAKQKRLRHGWIRLKRMKPGPESWERNTEPVLSAPPFCIKRHLVHRVKHATRHFYGGKYSHISYRLWCNNTGSSSGGEVTTKLDGSRLLCESCERNAIKKGEPTTDKLAGRHIHTGRMVPRQTCHVEERESN